MTSDERREAAENLREIDKVWPTLADDLEEDPLRFGALAMAGILACVDDSAVFRCLADLIDPTCHIVLKPSDSDFNDEPHYLCSRCGKEGIDVYERDDYTLAGIVDHARYCSNCGARVVRPDGY